MSVLDADRIDRIPLGSGDVHARDDRKGLGQKVVEMFLFWSTSATESNFSMPIDGVTKLLFEKRHTNTVMYKLSEFFDRNIII